MESPTNTKQPIRKIDEEANYSIQSTTMRVNKDFSRGLKFLFILTLKTKNLRNLSLQYRQYFSMQQVNDGERIELCSQRLNHTSDVDVILPP